MAKGSKKQRKRVTKTLSKAFRKLEVGQHLQQPQEPAKSKASSTTLQTSRRRQRHEIMHETSIKASRGSKINSEQAEFNREQTSLQERCWKKDEPIKNTKGKPVKAIQLQPPTFVIAADDTRIESGIAALEGIGNNHLRFMHTTAGESSTTFLIQQAHKVAAISDAEMHHNRFAALLESANETNDTAETDQCTPTMMNINKAFEFPPPLFQLSRPSMRDMPHAPMLASLDSLDV
jgi:hypothetical protein